MAHYHKLAFMAGLCLALVFTFSCGQQENENENDNSNGSNQSCEPTETHYCQDGTDLTAYGEVSHGGKDYKTVIINGTTWMAENLAIDVPGSKCYGEEWVYGDGKNGVLNTTLPEDEIRTICRKYGRLYDWETANSACPDGWHLASNVEWYNLVDFAKMTLYTGVSGERLKSRGDWGSDNYGIDLFGFAALPGGIGWFTENTFFEETGESLEGGFYSDYVNEESRWWTATGAEVDRAFAYSMSIHGSNVLYYPYKKDMFYYVRCVKGRAQ